MVLENIEIKIQDSISIYFIGDVHVGNINFARTEFKDTINKIKKDESAYIIGMGDYIDAINTKDKRFNPEEIDPNYKIKDLHNLPYIQANDFIEMMYPVKDRILCMLSGNHEGKLKSIYEFDVYNYICDKLNVEKRMNYIGMLNLRLLVFKGKIKDVTFMLNHGNGGSGKREGYPLNILHDTFRWSSCDVNAMGHIHQLIVDKKYFIGCRMYGKIKMNKQTRIYMVTGTYLKTYNENTTNYFEHKGKYDVTIGCPILNINKYLLDDKKTYGLNLTYSVLSF